MRIHGRRGGQVLFFTLILLSIVVLPTFAEPTLSATFGFDHQLVRYRFAPIVVTVSGLSEPVSGRILVRQFVGPDPSTPVTLEQELAVGHISSGVYPATLPAYDPILPVVVQLLDDQGNVLASASESVRQSARGLPFRVIAGAAYHIDDTESIVGVSELPADWWAYDPVESLWLAAPLTSRAVWLALGAWVSAGGSLVLFSGSDFYQWDSPLARDLLPFTNPVLREDSSGVPILTGNLRAGAQVLLTDGDLPLLVKLPYGAGAVTLVTERFHDVADLDLRRIDPRVPASRRLVSGDVLAQDLLNATPVLRPMYAFAPLVVLAIFAVLFVCRRLAARRMGFAALAFVMLTAVIAVLSSLYLNRVGHMAYQYRISTDIHMTTSFSMSTVSHAFFSLDPATVTFAQEKGAYPTEVHQVPTAKSMYAMTSETTSTTLDVPARVRRFLRGCNAQGAAFTATVDEAARTIRVDATGDRRPAAAMIFADGFFRRFPIDRLGETLSIDDLPRLSISAMSYPESLVYSAADPWIWSLPGVWFFALTEESQIAKFGDMPSEVRVVDIDMAEGVPG